MRFLFLLFLTGVLGSQAGLPRVVVADTDAVRALVTTAADARNPDGVRGDALQQLKAQGLPAVPTLIELAQNPNPDVRAVAVNALGQLDLKSLGDDVVVETLTAVAHKDPDPNLRLDALAVLGETGSRRALDVLVAALDDTDVRFRRRAVIGLVRLHRPEVVAPLTRRFGQEKDHEVRINIVRTLGSLGARAELEALRRSVTETDMLAEIDEQLQIAAFFSKPPK